MIFGMLPLALALGAGAEMRAPMARAVIGGLITSTLLTLLVVPVVYTVLDDFGEWIRRKWGAGQKAAVAALLLLAAGSAALVPAASAAEEPPGAEILTLDDALRIALENNRDIRKALELRKGLEGKYVEERAAALPQFTAVAEGSRRWDTTQEVFGIPPGNTTWDAQLGVAQPLYTGGQVTAAIRAARVGLATADDQLKVSRETALREVATVFHDILLARELNAIAVQNREQKARFLDEARKRNAAGTATDYDVLVSKVELENAEPAIVRTQNQILTLRERLRFLLGRDVRPVDARGDLAEPLLNGSAELAGALAKLRGQ
jgi:HAE1 family hydrophobic/amphiphilic exporter-1